MATGHTGGRAVVSDDHIVFLRLQSSTPVLCEKFFLPPAGKWSEAPGDLFQ